MAVRMAAPPIPPTTPPAIAPASECLLDEPDEGTAVFEATAPEPVGDPAFEVDEGPPAEESGWFSREFS